MAKFTKFEASEYLRNTEDMQLYLDACVEEDAGDGRLIAKAIGDIAKGRNMAQLARDTNLTREGLYKALSGEGNPTFATILKVSRALGLDLSFRQHEPHVS